MTTDANEARKVLSLGSKRLWAGFILLLLIFSIFHRAPNASYHPISNDCSLTALHQLQRLPQDTASQALQVILPKCGSIEEKDGYQLAFVEFDDQGAYFDQRQAFLAFYLMRLAISKPASGVEVFVYVHGWQHSAAPDDANVVQFREFLGMRSENSDLRVIGIYVGWPGKTLRYPLSLLTFWSRKNAAHRVASGAIQEFFSTLRQIKIDQQSESETGQNVEAVPRIYLIGHSLGGLIAFQANSQSFAIEYGNMVVDNRYGPRVSGFGDLVILINPAIEATRFESLRSLWSEYPNRPFYSPILVTVSSESDWPNRILFPLGVLTGTLLTHQLRKHQWETALTTVGNSTLFLTHRASINTKGDVVVCERPHSLAQRKVPFWFVTADPSLISGHSDLNSRKFIRLFETLQKHIQAKTVGGLTSCAKLSK